MKKYRIALIRYKNGRVEFMPQFKTFLMWKNIGYNGEIDFFANAAINYDSAQERIDLHFAGNTEVIEKKYSHQYKG
jgi:hypothetical protein